MIYRKLRMVYRILYRTMNWTIMTHGVHLPTVLPALSYLIRGIFVFEMDIKWLLRQQYLTNKHNQIPVMNEFCTYIIDNSNDEVFKQEIFEFIRYDLQRKIVAEAKIEIQVQ